MLRQAAATLALTLALGAPLPAVALDTSAGRVAITPVATGLTEPWGIAFLPDGRAGDRPRPWPASRWSRPTGRAGFST
jgi:glucose/arabinose dehydrogenase